ncbi:MULTISPECIES: hypothetical protein, partial [unclassified Bradyrhizobium]|uniref:hypothetical protein n=1 Tax=unclassified Bradyrhizobium TaxID=2631580 RepID=UPI0028E9FF0B
ILRTLIVVGRSDVVQLQFCVICHAVARPIGEVKRASSGDEFRKRRPKILPSYGSAQILANGRFGVDFERITQPAKPSALPSGRALSREDKRVSALPAVATLLRMA